MYIYLKPVLLALLNLPCLHLARYSDEVAGICLKLLVTPHNILRQIQLLTCFKSNLTLRTGSS